jgi:glycopeptide antibiotics resistance protein
MRLDSGFRRDFLINLFGFVPFGFVLMGVVGGGRSGRRSANLAIVVTIGFALSGGIEYTQSWFPARSSSVLDLILNTIGTALGAVGWVMAWKILKPG